MLLHQCVRFSHSIKHSHEIGVKHIARCLKGTKTKGIVMTPAKDNIRIDIYADTDFVGLYIIEDKLDPVSVTSRTEVLLTFVDVSILWNSELQFEIILFIL